MKPVLQALVLAEKVWEIDGGRKIIAGTFNRVFITQRPPDQEIETPDGGKRRLVPAGVDPGAPWAYINLTDVWDNTTIELQFVSLTRNRVVFSTSAIVKCNDRLATVEIAIPLPRLDIPEEGVYAFEVVCEGEVIGSHRITAKRHPSTQ